MILQTGQSCFHTDTEIEGLHVFIYVDKATILTALSSRNNDHNRAQNTSYLQ